MQVCSCFRVINAKVIQIVKRSESGTKSGRMCGILGTVSNATALLRERRSTRKDF